jgi:FKBP-type peptidyl-prolyl cis-trans isomerase 2
VRRPLLPFLAAALLLSGCARAVTGGSEVSFYYTLFVDGVQDDTNEGGPPAQVTQGKREVVPGLDDGLLGMKAGESKDVLIPAERAYGQPDPTALKTMPLSSFGAMAAQLRPGAVVKGMRDGAAAEGRVVSLDRRSVVLDFNHRLAGKAVRFHVRVVSVR